MRYLTMCGAPVEVKNRFQESRPLLRIYVVTKGWLRPRKEVVVEPVNPHDQGLQRLAAEVRERIGQALRERPDKPFYYPRPTQEHPHGRALATLDDPNVLEAIRSDFWLWRCFEDKTVAGYYILPSYSDVSEEQPCRSAR